MDSPIIGGLLAFVFGAAVAGLNYAINLYVLKRSPARLASMSVVRQTLNVASLAAAYLLARVLPWEAAPLLVGTAIGVTAPSVLLSMHLARINDALSEKVRREAEEGGQADG